MRYHARVTIHLWVTKKWISTGSDAIQILIWPYINTLPRGFTAWHLYERRSEFV